MISFTENKELYQFNDKKYLISLNFAKNLKPYRTKEKLNFNLYWRVPRAFERKQLLPIKSIIANHEELNSSNYNINLWSNVDLSTNKLLQPYSKYITHKIWNPIEELSDTPLEDYREYFKSIILDDDRCYLGGDYFRLLCLFKYGGFYIDMDMCVLRDLSPLNSYQFIYQWGSSGTIPSEPDIFFNGAIMKLNKNTRTAYKFIELLTKLPPIPNSFCWGQKLYNHVKDEDLKIFPCAWFNTEWGIDAIHPMSKNGDTNLYEGAFTWHWHNHWDHHIEEGSKFSILEKIIDDKLKNLGIV
jgi:hypothetical protein